MTKKFRQHSGEKTKDANVLDLLFLLQITPIPPISSSRPRSPFKILQIGFTPRPSNSA